MDIEEKVEVKPIPPRLSHPFFAKWHEFVLWKESTLNEWLLKLAARAVTRVQDSDDNMKRLAHHFKDDLVTVETHNIALNGIDDLHVLIDGLSEVKDQLKGKSKRLRDRNKTIKELKKEAVALEAALDILLAQKDQTRAEFFAEILQAQADAAAVQAGIADDIAEVEEALVQATLAAKALKK